MKKGLHFFLSAADNYATVALVDEHPLSPEGRLIDLIQDRCGVRPSSRRCLMSKRGHVYNGAVLTATEVLLMLGVGLNDAVGRMLTAKAYNNATQTWKEACCYVHILKSPQACLDAATGLLEKRPARAQRRWEENRLRVGANAAFAAARDLRNPGGKWAVFGGGGCFSARIPKGAAGTVYLSQVSRVEKHRRRDGVVFVTPTGRVLSAWIHIQDGPESWVERFDPDTKRLPWGTQLQRIHRVR